MTLKGGGGSQDLEKFFIIHAFTDISFGWIWSWNWSILIDFPCIVLLLTFIFCALVYQCSPSSIFALLENFRRSHFYSLTYHRFEFHTQTLSTVTMILIGWLSFFFFFLINQLTQLKNIPSNILYDLFSCRIQEEGRPTVSFPMMLQMNYLFSGNIPIF